MGRMKRAPGGGVWVCPKDAVLETISCPVQTGPGALQTLEAPESLYWASSAPDPGL